MQTDLYPFLKCPAVRDLSLIKHKGGPNTKKYFPPPPHFFPLIIMGSS